MLPREGLVRLEVFTLSLEVGRKATRMFPQQAGLYAWLGEELEKENPKATLERLMVLRVRGGQRAKLEEIAEHPYPTYFDPAQLPQTITMAEKEPASVPPAPPSPPPPDEQPGVPRPAGSSPAGRVFSPWPYISPTPQSFGFKNLGWTTEIELTMSDDGRTVDVSIAPELIRLCGMESQSPNGEIKQPIFETSQFNTMIQTKLGQPTLAGTFSPPVNTGVEGGNKEPLTRLLFVTVTEPR